MSSSETFVASWVTFCVRRCCSSLSFTRKSMLSSVIPEVLRNCWYCLSFWKTCFFWSSSAFRSSAGFTSMPRSSASCWTHSPWIRNCMTSRLRVSYSLLHCFLSASSLGFFWPFGTGVFDFAATHFSKSGGSGTAAAAPGCCDWPFTAIVIHLSNSSCVMVESPTFATAPAGTLLPQPARATRPRRAAARASRECVKARVMAERRRRVANEVSDAGRFRRDLENRLRGGHNGRETIARLVREAHPDGLAARLVDRLRHPLAQRLRPPRVELDRRDRHALGGEADGARPGAAELDPGVLQADEVVERRGKRAEPVRELLAQHDELGDPAGARDAPVDLDLGGFVGHVVARHVGVDRQG